MRPRLVLVAALAVALAEEEWAEAAVVWRASPVVMTDHRWDEEEEEVDVELELPPPPLVGLPLPLVLRDLAIL